MQKGAQNYNVQLDSKPAGNQTRKIIIYSSKVTQAICEMNM